MSFHPAHYNTCAETGGAFAMPQSMSDANKIKATGVRSGVVLRGPGWDGKK